MAQSTSRPATSAPSTPRRSWLFRLPSYRRHGTSNKDKDAAPPSTQDVPELLRSGPSSSSSHEAPPTPVDGSAVYTLGHKRPQLRSRLSLDVYAPLEGAHIPSAPSQVLLPADAVTEPDPHSGLGTIAREPSRKLRKLRKTPPPPPDPWMSPPSSFRLDPYSPYLYPGVPSSSTAVRPVSILPPPSNQSSSSRTPILLDSPTTSCPTSGGLFTYRPTSQVYEQDLDASVCSGAAMSPDASSTSLSPQHFSPGPGTGRTPRSIIQARSEDGHTSHHRVHQRASYCSPIKTSSSVTFLPATSAPRPSRPTSYLHASPHSATTSRETIATTSTLRGSPSPHTSSAPFPSPKRQARKLIKRQPPGDGTTPSASSKTTKETAAPRSSIICPGPQDRPGPRPRTTSFMVRPSSMLQLIGPSSALPTQHSIPRTQSDYGHGSDHTLTRAASGYRARPLPATPPVLPPTPILTTSSSSSSTGHSPLTPPRTMSLSSSSPSLQVISRLTLESDSSTAIAARLSCGYDLGLSLEPVPSEPMISGKGWIIGEEESNHSDEFDPYALSESSHLAVPMSDDGHRKRRRSPNSSQGCHAPHASRSRSRSRGRAAMEAARSKSRSRSRSCTRTAAHGDAVGSFVRMRGAKEVNPMRRWTLAMADSCYDEAVLAEFDALHVHSSRGDTHRHRKRRSFGLDENLDTAADPVRRTRDLVYGGPFSLQDVEVTEDLIQATRRALLSCRDLVRTEKSYQTLLLQLQYGKTKVPPPPLMLTYVPALLDASTELLAALGEDPSVWGLAKAFLTQLPVLEAAYVPWCGAVGQWFTKSEAPPSIFRKMTAASVPTTPASTVAERRKSRAKLQPRPSVDTPTAGSSGRKSLMSITPFMNNAADATATADRTWRLSTAAGASTTTLGHSEAPLRERVDSFGVATGKTPAVRDLAIQPTQRVMRYVLQYQDLLKHTPPGSATHAVLTEAWKAATSLAEKCDRAQGNAAFLARTS